MKKSFLIAGLLLASSVVRAEVLTWSVDLGVVDNATYATAQLFASSTQDTSFGTTGTSIGDAIYKDSVAQFVVAYDSNVTAGTAYFYVKLFNSTGDFISYSDTQSWSQLWNAGSLVSGNTPDVSAANPWSTTSVTAVPEPTAMALLAMGVSAMLLRRKRVA